MCEFNFCELINGLFLGIFSSILASIIVIKYLKIKEKKTLKDRFGYIAGNYWGYGYSSPDTREWNLKENKQSEAEIHYLEGNTLEICLKEYPFNGQYKWTGLIKLDTEHSGTIVWNYDIYDGLEFDKSHHKYGLKRLLVKKKHNDLFIYLVEENIISKEIFSKEVLIRK